MFIAVGATPKMEGRLLVTLFDLCVPGPSPAAPTWRYAPRKRPSDSSGGLRRTRRERAGASADRSGDAEARRRRVDGERIACLNHLNGYAGTKRQHKTTTIAMPTSTLP